MCLVCRVTQPRNLMFRLVKVQDDGIAPNPDGRIAGKGIYLCRSGECLTRMHKERRLRRLVAEKLMPGTSEWMQAGGPGPKESEP